MNVSGLDINTINNVATSDESDLDKEMRMREIEDLLDEWRSAVINHRYNTAMWVEDDLIELGVSEDYLENERIMINHGWYTDSNEYGWWE